MIISIFLFFSDYLKHLEQDAPDRKDAQSKWAVDVIFSLISWENEVLIFDWNNVVETQSDN